jgi:hypothetical protein
VNVTAALAGVVPFGVLTVTFLVVRVAVLDTVNVAVRLVPAELTVIALAETPPPPVFTAVAPVKSLPVMVTATLMVPEAG